MGVPGNANALLLRSAAAAGGYQVSRSLRFNSSDSAYCSRLTWGTPTDRRRGTISMWAKRASFGTTDYIIYSYNGSAANSFGIYFDSDNTLEFQFGGASAQNIRTSAVFRDPSAWYHLVFAWDTTDATPANRVKIYVNNVQQTIGTTNYPSQNVEAQFPATTVNYIGFNSTSTFDGYLADVIFVDGQQLTPSSFTEVSATTGQLIPKAYSGSFGTNGFWLKFSDNSAATATTLGKDYSGNSNNFTPNNLSVTAGAGNDSLVDTPTSYGTDTGAGGEVRGNYATLNPLVKTTTTTLSNGNLDATSSEQLNAVSTFVPSSGKWYWEITLGTIVTNSFIGLYGTTPLNNDYLVYGINGYGFLSAGFGSASSTVSGTGVTGDVIGLAFDVDAKTLQYYKNGSSIGTISGFTFPANWSLGISCNATVSTPWSFNFGQRPFAYTAPSGFKALCDTNLPAPVVAKPSTVMDVKLYTGNASSNAITGLGFSPDLVWIKSRSSANWHNIFDVVRGNNRILYSNATNAEEVETTASLTSFDSTGFTLSGNGSSGVGNVNGNGTTYVAWAWDAGTTTSSNVAGSITSQVRANPSAGFSIITFTMGSGSYTVGHGLNTAPSLLITKARSNTSSWWTYHASLGTGSYLALNSTAAAASDYSWGSAPTSTVFTANNNFFTNGYTYVVYAFSPVAGYSSFGSYTGNGSADGPFIYTGFRPKFILVKNTSVAGAWEIYDSVRNPYNVMALTLLPNTSDAEITASNGVRIDFTSNGFKWRDSGSSINGSGNTIIWAAFAESPFQYARAR